MRLPAFLSHHPFGVQAFFEESLVVCYAIPANELAGLVPPCLRLDTLDDKWGFIAVAMVQAKDLRPRGFPKFLGGDFFLIGYRVFVQYRTPEGKRLRGLYILRSETDKKWMKWLGNLFTQYRYVETDISRTVDGPLLMIRSVQSRLALVIGQPEEEFAVPAGSPFKDWKTARRFAGPMPYTFSFRHDSGQVNIVEGVRENWIQRPVEVVSCQMAFLDPWLDRGAVLASAFLVRQVPYRWKKGKTATWTG